MTTDFKAIGVFITSKMNSEHLTKERSFESCPTQGAAKIGVKGGRKEVLGFIVKCDMQQKVPTSIALAFFCPSSWSHREYSYSLRKNSFNNKKV